MLITCVRSAVLRQIRHAKLQTLSQFSVVNCSSFTCRHSSLLVSLRSNVFLRRSTATPFSALIIARMVSSETTCDKFERLPEIAKPSHYAITLSPDLKTFKCEGHETVDVKILQPTDHFKLHSSEINVKAASIALADGSVHNNLEIAYDKKWTTFTVKFPQKINPQKVKVSFEFDTVLNDKMRGFYRSHYKDSSGNVKHMASTQFESTYARYSFPCWDEPIYKATFDITLKVDSDLTALSNMNAISETKEGDKKVVKFATTPIMSTYLVAFAVGELEYLEDKTKSGCITRLYTVPGKKEQGKFALELATKAIDWYIGWFGINYPLPKCDLIAIPDFSMGAMENWGLVTYREVALLVDPAKSSTRQKSHVALVVAHELAHLWFGDLVTMKWWTDLWLKEGFASFMEYMFVGANYPEYKIWLHFLNDELAQGFALDALKSSHPIEVEINNPNELDDIYDNITYAKSNSVNRMLFHYLGEETFQKGLRIYLNRFQYSNATTVDLWNAHSEASGQDINTMMSGWTKQMGYPLITVSEEKQGNKRILSLKQSRFIADGSEDDQNLVWQVPISISTSSDPTKPSYKILLKEKEAKFTFDVPADNWIKLNAETSGFYRVAYADEMLKAMLADVSSKKLPVLDRFGLANDIFALVMAGKVPASDFLALFKASVNEDEYAVWCTLDSGISSLVNVVSRSENHGLKERLDSFICKCLEPVLKRYRWDAAPGEDPQIAITRALIIGRLGKCNHQETINKARQLFKDHIEKDSELHPDLRLVVYSIIGRNDGRKGMESLKRIFMTSGFGEVERNCIIALAQAVEPDVLADVFQYGCVESNVRSQDIMLMFYGARATKIGQDFIWSYLKEHNKLFLEKFGGTNSSLYQHCFKASTDCHCSNDVAADVESFVKNNMDADEARTLDRTVRQVTESIRLNEKLLKRSTEPLIKFLSENGF